MTTTETSDIIGSLEQQLTQCKQCELETLENNIRSNIEQIDEQKAPERLCEWLEGLAMVYREKDKTLAHVPEIVALYRRMNAVANKHSLYQSYKQQ
jgi:uncharacterized Zn finger protein